MDTYEDEPALVWKDARVLINEDGYLIGAVRKTWTGFFCAYDMVNLGGKTFETEQEAVRWVEEALAS